MRKASPPASSISLTTESTRSIQKRIMRPTYLISSWSPTFGRCATVDEVIGRDARVHIHGFDPRSSTVHWRFAEPSGRQIVLEIIDGKCVFYENHLGVLTNSPSFDWQLTNLRQLCKPSAWPYRATYDWKYVPVIFGGGSAMIGFPGDFTRLQGLYAQPSSRTPHRRSLTQRGPCSRHFIFSVRWRFR